MSWHRPALAVAVIAITAFEQRASFGAGQASDSDHRVILVVSDGLRWQEVFRGADSAILSGVPDAEAARRRYWHADAAERRTALMPFVSGAMMRDGVQLGNRDRGSRVDVTNGLAFSYPGYNEMLTGQPDERINRNDFGPNPNVTVFEWLHGQRGFADRVAAFGSWETFEDIFNVARSGLPVHTNGRPDDILVHRAAFPWLRDKAPRAAFIAYTETDDWGHEGRYDRYLDAAHAVDSYLAELWEFVQSDRRYRNRTTILFAADHGRGRTAADWMHHGNEVDGADESFILAIGPGVDGIATRKAYVLGDVARLVATSVGQRFEATCGRSSGC